MNSTEGMTARETLLWVLQQPDEVEIEYENFPGMWVLLDAVATTLKNILALVEYGYTFRIAAPKPAAPERVWVHVNQHGNPAHVSANRPEASDIEYIRKDIAEAMVPRGREAFMAKYMTATWFECAPENERATRVLILDGDGHD